jgi:hypothetical protein
MLIVITLPSAGGSLRTSGPAEDRTVLLKMAEPWDKDQKDRFGELS